MAFITAETRSDLIELSVAMLKQAPSAALLEELIALSVGGGSLADAADHIAKTDAFKAEYPSFQTAEQYAAEIFDNITTGGTVTADIRTAVIELATGMLTSGSVTKAGLALAIAEYLAAPAALLNTDFADIAQSFQNRADAAEYFVVTKELGGSTDAELAAAIASVTSDAATLTAANTAADATASAEAVVAGQTFTLTTGLDTLTGAATNDTFSAVDSAAIGGAPTTTLNAGDSISAGSGTDRLSIAASTGSATTSAAVSSSTVEEIALYNNSGAGYTVDTSLMTGLTDLYVAGGNSTAAFTGVNSSPNVHLTSANSNVTVTNAATVGLGDADAVTIALNGAAATGDVTLSYNDIETFNVVSSGAATGTSTTTLTLSSDQLETVNASGSAAAKISATMTGAATVSQVGTLDASDMTGALTATVVAGASGKLSVTGGTGADTLTVNGGAMNSDLTIDGGAGVDTLVVTSAAYNAAAVTQAGAGVTNMEVLLVAGSASLQAFSNNTFAGLVSLGAASITGLGTGAVSLTATAGGNQTLDRATDGAADVATVSLAGAAAQTIASLNVADEETVTINSGSLAAGSNAITAIVGTDLTSLTIAGSRDLTIGSISGTALATLDASGLSGTGTVLSVSAANSTANMTVTGAAGVESTDGEVMNIITTGSGNDAITTGDYADTITAGDGNNTVVAGDGDNTVTTGRGNDTITVGDGNNTITAGIGNDTVTAGGTTTTAAVFDTNTVDLGNGNDTYTGGAGRDIVTLGAGDDTVDTGAGTDSIYMSDFDDDDVVNGGAGADTLSVSALASAAALAGAQVQAVSRFIDVTPGTSRTASPQFTGVESVYMDVNLAAANLETSATTTESVDFTASSGITNLYLNVTDADNTNAAQLTLTKIDASAIHLIDSGTTDDLGELVVAGDGQASLTLKGHDFDGGTDLTVSDVSALTITAYQGNTLVAVGDSSYGDVEADDSDTVTVTMPSTTAALAGGTMTLNSLSADTATAIALNAGSNNTLAVTAGVASTSDALDTLSLTVSDDGTLTAADVDSTNGDLSAVTITLGVNSTLTVTNELDVAEATAGTITVGAASTLTMSDLIIGGAATTITGTASSTVDIDTYGKTGLTASTITLSGRGNLTPTFAIDGDTSVSVAGWTDVDATAWTITTTGNDDLGFTSNVLPVTATVGNGDNTITTSSGADTIKGTVTQTATITFGDADGVIVTVNGVAAASITAATSDAATATLIVNAINATSSTSYATAAKDGNDDVVITYSRFISGATVVETDGGDTVATVGTFVLAGLNTGDNTYTTGAGNDAVMGSTGDSAISLGDGVDVYTFAGGADTINTGGNDSDADIIAFAADAADIAATWTDTAGGSTVDVSNAPIITAYTADKLNLIYSAGDFAAVNAATVTQVTTAATIGNADDVDLYTGTYDSATGLFTSTATADATDLLLVYDNDVAGTADYSAIVLVGGVTSTGTVLAITELTGVLTLGAWA